MKTKINDELDDEVKAEKGDSRRCNKSFISNIFAEYCSSTSIHGIGYLGAEDKSMTEKLWWLTVFTLSVIACAFLIKQTWNKWQNTPVIMSFSHTQTAIWEIPFPAVTICPVNKVQQSIYNYTETYHLLVNDQYNMSEEDTKKFWDISLICNNNLIEFNGNDTITDESAIDSIIEVSPPLHQTILAVSWQQGKMQPASNYFTPQLTEEGLCFTFNSLTGKDMYTDQITKNLIFDGHDNTNKGWTLEDGYPEDMDISTYPKRIVQEGLLSGISIGLMSNVGDRDYICEDFDSGYKVLVHNPADNPRVSQHYVPVPLNTRVTVFVTPKLVTTSNSILHISPETRNCYFAKEKTLRFYKMYTEDNCQIECLANVTRQLCQCLPFYSPRDNETNICGLKSMECVENAQKNVLKYEMMRKKKKVEKNIEILPEFQIFKQCNCRPPCTSLHYIAESSQTNIDFKKFVEIAYNVTLTSEAITELRIAFTESDFMALYRREMYGLTDFLANCGGLLGLFMGFSFLSLLEIIYFVTLRIWCRMRNKELNDCEM